MKTKIVIGVLFLSLFFGIILSSKDSPKDYGIGPVKSIKLNAVDLKAAKWG